MKKIVITDEANNSGYIEDEDGNRFWGPLPPNDGPLLEVYNKMKKDGIKEEVGEVPPMFVNKPRSTDMWKAVAVMKYTQRNGSLLYDQIIAAINTLPAKNKIIALQALEKAPTFDMDGELVPLLSGAVGMDEAEVQALVDEANNIRG